MSSYIYPITCPLCSGVGLWWTRDHLIRCSYLAMTPASVLGSTLQNVYIQTVQCLTLAVLNDYPKPQRFERAVYAVANAYKHTCQVDEKHTAIGEDDVTK